jgi:hypothetical protein
MDKQIELAVFINQDPKATMEYIRDRDPSLEVTVAFALMDMLPKLFEELGHERVVTIFGTDLSKMGLTPEPGKGPYDVGVYYLIEVNEDMATLGKIRGVLEIDFVQGSVFDASANIANDKVVH